MSLGGKGEGDVSILSSQLIGVVVQCGVGVRASCGKGWVELVSTLNVLPGSIVHCSCCFEKGKIKLNKKKKEKKRNHNEKKGKKQTNKQNKTKTKNKKT